MVPEEGGDVDVMKAVARGDEDRFAFPEGLELLRSACRPEQFRLMRPVDVHPEGRAVPEVALDHLRGDVQVDAHVEDVVPPQKVQKVMQDRPVRHGHHRLRQEVGERPEARAEPRRHHHRLHTETASSASASAIP
jgi:hypothetical protein